MATLTDTAYYSRQGVKYGAIGFVALLLLYWTGTGLIRFWQATHPAPPPPPAASFGILPSISFPEDKATVASFDLQTPTGTLGTFPDRLRVFVATAKKSSFLAADNANQLAKKLGFTGQPTLESSTRYRWSSETPLPSALEMDIINTYFSLTRAWPADPTLVTNKRFTGDQQTILDARNFLTQAGLLATDLIGGEKATYLRASGSQFIAAISLSEADFVKVDFFRQPFSPPALTSPSPTRTPSPAAGPEYAFFTPDPLTGLISIIVSGSPDAAKRIISVDYRYTPIEYESFSDYPLKTADQAWEELSSGGGYIASFTGSGPAVIRRVNLGYFDPLTPHEFIMPIYVFSGDNNFVAYVSALAETVVQAATQP